MSLEFFSDFLKVTKLCRKSYFSFTYSRVFTEPFQCARTSLGSRDKVIDQMESPVTMKHIAWQGRWSN